jgi:CelD/BcsL family acetyltransferase involved in cellulose biosynthesis
VNALSLHEGGAPDLERLAIEYNGFLVDRSGPAELPAQLLKLLSEWSSQGCFERDWDELCLPGVAVAWVDAMRASGLVTAIDRSEPAIGIALDGMRNPEDLLRRLGANTRSQVRRSLRELAKRGPVELDCASTVDSAQDYLARLGELNRRRWDGTQLRSPYASSTFLDFHAALVARALPRGEVELLALRVGGQPIGYAYNFLWQRTVHQYSSGFAAEPDMRVKVGLACHVLSAARYAERGFLLYDLMAGDARYKRSLGQQHETLFWIRGQRKRAKLRAEAALVGLKQALTRLYGRGRPSKSDR